MQLEDHETLVAASLQETQRKLFAARQQEEIDTQRLAEYQHHLAKTNQVAAQRGWAKEIAMRTDTPRA